MKLIYKPFGIIFGIIAGKLATQLFNAVWGVIDKEAPPSPTTREASWAKVLLATAVQATTFSVTRAVVDRSGAKWFESFTGAWPGPKETVTKEV